MAHEDLAFLGTMENVGYIGHPLPTRRDEEIRALVDSLTSQSAYVALRRRVTWDQSKTLEVFAERAASLAVKKGDERVLLSGLVALYLAGFDEDQEAELSATRESILVVPLLLTSAKKMGVKVRRLIRSLEKIVGRKRARALRKFWLWSFVEPSLARMGYRETTDPNAELLYERIPESDRGV